MSTKIEWTDETWNPVVGCSRVSAGCQNCYAERVAHRGMAPQHRGLTIAGPKGPRWNGDVRFVPHVLDKPLRWTKPRMVFVNSLSDLFHEGVTNEQIALVFAIMAAAPAHTFQVLTKRPQRMVEWFRWAESREPQPDPEYPDGWNALLEAACSTHEVNWPSWVGEEGEGLFDRWRGVDWPLPNVWLGVSVEDQATADERIPLLLEVPAAVRWVSYEPALGPVDFGIDDPHRGHEPECIDGAPHPPMCLDCSDFETEKYVEYWRREPRQSGEPGIDWIVVGGESGPGARPFNVEWARSTIRQGRDAEVPVFCKQLGADVRWSGCSAPGEHWPDGANIVDVGGEWRVKLHDRKGGAIDEWPEDLRVREMPGVADG